MTEAQRSCIWDVLEHCWFRIKLNARSRTLSYGLITTDSIRRLMPIAWIYQNVSLIQKTIISVTPGFIWRLRLRHHSLMRQCNFPVCTDKYEVLANVHVPEAGRNQQKKCCPTLCRAVPSSISFVYAENNCDPTTEPCGTIQFSLMTADLISDVQKTCVRSIRYEFNLLWTVSCTPNLSCNSFNRILWSTVSNNELRRRSTSTVLF